MPNMATANFSLGLQHRQGDMANEFHQKATQLKGYKCKFLRDLC